jgi:hypothetical protein
MMSKMSLLVTVASAEAWNDTGKVANQINASRAAILAQEWHDSCETRPDDHVAACKAQCVKALSVAGCESEWDSLARNPTGCNGNKCMGIMQLGCQWLHPQYACKELAAKVFTSKGLTTCANADEPFTAPVLDSAVMQLSQCLLEVVSNTPYNDAAWTNQWSCANATTDPHYVAAGKLAKDACQNVHDAKKAEAANSQADEADNVKADELHV